VKSLDNLKLVRRPIDRNRRETDRVLDAMRKGARLVLRFQNGRPPWRLSSGEFVPWDAATIVINRSDIASCGDTLFYGMPGQTWRLRTKE
jgi:hypothetical protein